jgi:hypothetical protein
MKTSLKILANLGIFGLVAMNPNLVLASPDDGATCRAGYTGKLNAGKFTCEKTVVTKVEFSCPEESPLRNYVVRVNNQRDLCAANDLNIPSSGSLEGYDQAGARIPGQPLLIKVPNTVQLTGVLAARAGVKEAPGGFRTIPFSDADFVFVGANEGANKARAMVTARAHATTHNKGAADFKIETKAASHRIINDGGSGSRDALEVTITEFTLPIVTAN